VTHDKIEYIFERSCLRKANLTEEVANSIIDRCLQQENRMLYYYKCNFCNSFHLTSQEPTSETKVEVI
jgi:hypothetical protein